MYYIIQRAGENRKQGLTFTLFAVCFYYHQMPLDHTHRAFEHTQLLQTLPSGAGTLQEDTTISVTPARTLSCVRVRRADHSAATAGQACDYSLPLSLGYEVKSSQFSKWKITDTDTIMRVCVKGCELSGGDKASLHRGHTPGQQTKYRICSKSSTHFLSPCH